MRKLLFLLMGMVLCVSFAQAQNRTLSGRVVDALGNPLPNVSVVVKGSSTGTTTNPGGTFSLQVPESAQVLVFSSVGMEQKEVIIGNKTTFTVSMEVSSNDLEEVVVQVPYGTIKKTAFTGSESTITAQSIQKQQVTSVTKAIEGLVPGVIATNGGGAPGTGASILVRGIGSYSGSSSPLYVLNGVPYDGPISSISTDEIESVTVLKDAAAAALYGSRAANGVIMINTKRGRKGSQVSATVRQGFMSRGIPEYDRLDQKEYYEMMWEATRNSFEYSDGMTVAAAGLAASQQLTDGNHLVYNAYNVPGDELVDPVTGKLNPDAQLKWTDSWQDALFRTASRTNVNVNISGATDKSDYFISFGYLDEQGTVVHTGYKRYNARVNVNTHATSWLNAGINLDGAYAERKQAIGETGGSAGSSAFYFSRGVAPIYPVYEYDPDTGTPLYDSTLPGGRKFDWGGTGSNMGTRPYLGNVNPLGNLVLDDRSTYTVTINANPYMEIKFLKDFAFKTTLGINLWDDNSTTYQNNQYGDAASNGGRSTKTDDRQMSLTLNEVLSWGKSFGQHNLKALAGHENYKYQYNILSANKQGFSFAGQTELDNGSEIFGQPSSYQLDHRIESYFASVNYDYDQKYLFSASYRTDGSSRFSDDARWGNFYSAGLGWRMSQEDFMSSISWINDLKFKVSYGEQGNENLGSLYYPYKVWYYADGTGGYSPPSRPASPDLKWEGNKTFNVGFDFAMFSNRLQGTIEYFNRISDDLLFDVPMPTSTGYISQYQNIGTLKNTGLDLQLGYTAIRGKEFDWRVDLNLTHFKNKFTKLPPTQKETGIVTGVNKIMEGKSRYDFWLREFAGVDASTGEGLFYKDVLGTDGKPTGERVLTNNISQASYYYEGSAIPDFSGGLVNSFRYRNFDLSFLLTFSYGGLFYDGNYALLMHTGSYGQAWHTDIKDRWQKPGDVTNVPRVQSGVDARQDGTSSRFLVDGSYLNIKNITLSYTVPVNVVRRAGMQSVQVFGNVDNAYLFTAKKGMDPQRSFGGTASNSYPPYRTITFGVNVTL